MGIAIFQEKMTRYSRKLTMPFEDVLNKVTENLAQQGFSVITTLNMQDTFRPCFDPNFRKYRILGVYNAPLAFKAITLESHAGIMLPCNVVIQELPGGEVEISARNPLEAIAPDQQSPALQEVAQEIGIRLRAAVDFIARRE
jgi:uncharacterized protein (DUF302 family)